MVSISSLSGGAMRNGRLVVAALAVTALPGCSLIQGQCGEYVGRWRARTDMGGSQDINIVRDGSTFRLELSGMLYNMTLGATCQGGMLRTGGWLGDITYSQGT